MNMEQEEEKKVKFFTRFNVLYIVCVIIFPAIPGLIISLVNGDITAFEVMYVVFGLLDLLLITIRLRVRDNHNFRKNKSVVEDKTTVDYKQWLYFQYIIAIAGFADLAISLVAFVIAINI